MTRTMYDAVSPSGLPKGAPLYAGYVDGMYANVAQIKALFPNAIVVGIAVSSHTNDGEVLDVENYDATPTEAPGWVQMRRAAGVDPSVYCNSSTWPAVIAAFAAAGVAAPHYWIAQYDGDPTIPAGAVAKQFNDLGGYDISSVADVWPGIDPQETDMPLSDADKTWITGAINGAFQSPANRGLAVADDLWWWQHAISGTVPTGASPAAAAAILAIHAEVVKLEAEPAPTTTPPAKA